MTNEDFTLVDMNAIEAQARALRAQAARDMASTVSKWVRRQITFGAATPAQSAA